MFFLFNIFLHYTFQVLLQNIINFSLCFILISYIYNMNTKFKERFIKSTIILIIGGLLTKVLGMLIKIISTKTIGSYGIGLYMMILPTFNLFITIATLSLPTSISKLVAENTKNNKKLVLGVVPIVLLFDCLLILIIIILSPFIASFMLHNKSLTLPIICISITLPFITISSILRGYFFGKQKMFPQVLSNFTEQVVRILLILIFIPIFKKYGIIYAVCFLVLSNVISELSSIFIFLFFAPKKISIKREDIICSKDDIKDIMSISLPTTMSRLVSSISMFLEPIIITFVFLRLGYNISYITNEYGIITGYIMPIVFMPNFLTSAVSIALLPEITRCYAKGDIKTVKKRINQSFIYSLIIGIPCSIILVLFPSYLLNLIYKTDIGASYLRVSAIIFSISYILGPLSSILQTINKSKTIFISNLIGCIIKNITLFLLLYLKLDMYPLLISYFLSYLYIVIHQYKIFKKVL